MILNQTQIENQLTDRFLVHSLRFEVCPACGKPKKPRQTLCYSDYKRLPHGKKMALYDLLGEGYKEAVVDALRAGGRRRSRHYSEAGGDCHARSI